MSTKITVLKLPQLAIWRQPLSSAPSQSVSVNFLLLPQLVSQVHSKSIPSKLLHELLQARVVVVVREDDGLQSR
jgi:hypothetical protein